MTIDANEQARRRRFGTFRKRLATVVTLAPPFLSVDGALLQQSRYRRALDQWDQLAELAADDGAATLEAMKSLATGQRSLNHLREAASALPTLGIPNPRPLNTYVGWRSAATEIRRGAVEKGVPESVARRGATEIGHMVIKDSLFTQASQRMQDLVGSTYDQRLRLNLRQYAGGLTAGALAAFNREDEADEGRVDGSPSSTLEQLELRVFSALQNGQSGVAESNRLARTAEALLPTAVGQLRAKAPGSRESLDATTQVKSCLEAAVIGQLLAWKLSWLAPERRGFLARVDAESVFEGPAQSPSLVAARLAPDGAAQGIVTRLQYRQGMTQIQLRTGDGAESQVVVPHTDLAQFGCCEGAYAEVLDGYASEGNLVTPAFILPDAPVSGWRELVRQTARGAFLADPAGIGVRWSWTAGLDGSVSLVTSGTWFS